LRVHSHLRANALDLEYYGRAQPRLIGQTLLRSATWFDIWLGRQIFGNTSPAITNIIGQFHMARARHAFRCRVHRSSYLQDNVARDGFTLLPPALFPPGILQELADEMDLRIEDERYSIRTGENLAELDQLAPSRTYARKLLDPRDLSSLSSLVPASVRDTIEAAYGAFFSIVSVECYRTYHVPAEIAQALDVYSHHWHFDQRAIDIAKVLVNLSDVSERDGAFRAIPMRESRRLLKKKWFRGRESIDFDPCAAEIPSSQSVELIGPRGTSMLCNTQLCLHRAGVPSLGHHRDILQLVLSAARGPLTPDWHLSIDPLFGKRSKYVRTPTPCPRP